MEEIEGVGLWVEIGWKRLLVVVVLVLVAVVLVVVVLLGKRGLKGEEERGFIGWNDGVVEGEIDLNGTGERVVGEELDWVESGVGNERDA